MSNIVSNVMPNTIWKIKRIATCHEGGPAAVPASVLEVENEFIRNLDPVVFCNDLTGKSYCMDTKLPTGFYLENIKPIWQAGMPSVYEAVICY